MKYHPISVVLVRPCNFSFSFSYSKISELFLVLVLVLVRFLKYI